MIKKIDEKDIFKYIQNATNVFIHNDKLIIDNNLKRIIITDILNAKDYLNLFYEVTRVQNGIKEYGLSEKNLKLILEYYPNTEKRDWLAKILNLSKDQVGEKYRGMLNCFEKNNRYSRQYWKEELEDLKKNKNNLEYHAKKYNRSINNLKDIIRQKIND